MTAQDAAQRLLGMDQVLILTHRRPDGDTIGCASALCLALQQKGKTAWVLPNEDAHHLFDPYLEGVLAPAGFVPQAVVAVDVAALGMLPDSAKGYREAIDLVIDHHGSQEYYGKETCVDPACAACGEPPSGEIHFAPVSGVIFCGDCLSRCGEQAMVLSPGVFDAMRHIIYSPFDRLFAFRLPPEGLARLARVSEAYLLAQVERVLPALNFYKTVCAGAG